MAGADPLIRSTGPLTVIGGLVLVLVAVLALREVASLVVPVMFGPLIALTAWPMVGALERRGVRRGFALAGAVVVVLGVVVLVASIAALSVGELVVQIPKYETRLSATITALRDLLAQLGIGADRRSSRRRRSSHSSGRWRRASPMPAARYSSSLSS